MDNSLLMHTVGGHYVSQADLLKLPYPPQLGSRHQPIPHGKLVEVLQEECRKLALTVESEQLGLTRRGARLFGTMRLRGRGTLQADDLQSTLGLRNSIDQSLGVRMVVGATVFVCDNMCMSGDEIVLRRKNTIRLKLPMLVAKGLEKFLERTTIFGRRITYMKDYGLSGDNAKALLFDVFNKGVLPKSMMQTVARLYLSPLEEHLDCRPRSLWGLNNACTRALKSLKPASQFDAAARVGAHFAKLVNIN